MKKTVGEIATYLSGTVLNEDSVEIVGVTNYLSPQKDHITFINDLKLLSQVEDSPIGCIIAPETVHSSKKPCIIVKNPKLAFALVLQLFFPKRTFDPFISEKATIHPSATIGNNVTIEDYVIIQEGVTIGDNTTIRSFTYIDHNVSIGKDCLIDPNVMIYDRTQIGNRVTIQSSCVIGSDGFGYVPNQDGTQVKVPQIGNVVIEDDVEMGSNVSIDRATFGSTILRKGVKLDNLIQIAHNVDVDINTVISGHAGIAGSAKIGKNCIIAAATGIGDHVVIEDNVILGGKAGVPSKKKLRSNNLYMGMPCRPFKKFAETQGLLAKLPFLMDEVKKMKQKIEEYEKIISQAKK